MAGGLREPCSQLVLVVFAWGNGGYVAVGVPLLVRRGGSGDSREQGEQGKELHRQEALWQRSLMFGYVHRAADAVTVCEGIPTEKVKRVKGRRE